MIRKCVLLSFLHNSLYQNHTELQKTESQSQMPSIIPADQCLQYCDVVACNIHYLTLIYPHIVPFLTFGGALL